MKIVHVHTANKNSKIKKGVNCHIRKAHPEIYRRNIYACNSDIDKEISVPKTVKENNFGKSNDKLKHLDEELSILDTKFNKVFDLEEEFGNEVENFGNFLYKLLDYLPGPKHPAKKF